MLVVQFFNKKQIRQRSNSTPRFRGGVSICDRVWQGGQKDDRQKTVSAFVCLTEVEFYGADFFFISIFNDFCCWLFDYFFSACQMNSAVVDADSTLHDRKFEDWMVQLNCESILIWTNHDRSLQKCETCHHHTE